MGRRADDENAGYQREEQHEATARTEADRSMHHPAIPRRYSTVTLFARLRG
jgi:hypothetical protein